MSPVPWVKRLERIRATERALSHSAAAAAVSHDANSPLNVVVGRLGLIGGLDAASTEHLARAQSGLDRLVLLLRNAAERSDANWDCEKISLIAALRNLVELYEEAFPQAKIDAELQGDVVVAWNEALLDAALSSWLGAGVLRDSRISVSFEHDPSAHKARLRIELAPGLEEHDGEHCRRLCREAVLHAEGTVRVARSDLSDLVEIELRTLS